MRTMRGKLSVGTCIAVIAVVFLAPSIRAEEVTETPKAITPSATELISGECLPDLDGVQMAGGTTGVRSDLSLSVGCLPSQPLSCAQMPQYQGGSCSCESQLLARRCLACDVHLKGQVLSTTCTSRPPPCQGTCDIQQVITRSSLSCAG